MSFSFGDIRGEAEVEDLGDDVASPHPSTRGGAKLVTFCNMAGFVRAKSNLTMQIPLVYKHTMNN